MKKVFALIFFILGDWQKRGLFGFPLVLWCSCTLFAQHVADPSVSRLVPNVAFFV